ncbi:NAC domain [Dillenia turbinata]|uniref:NAC domain n=1 Tax=Dillenia turbinata TaxID=194707 RepID=A0AAN8VWZ4_9MAGN
MHADMQTSSEKKMYFLSMRDPKHPNGKRQNRTTPTGYWKATGADHPIYNRKNEIIGYKMAPSFYERLPPPSDGEGQTTSWIMYEYKTVKQLFDDYNKKMMKRVAEKAFESVQEIGIQSNASNNIMAATSYQFNNLQSDHQDADSGNSCSDAAWVDDLLSLIRDLDDKFDYTLSQGPDPMQE